MRSAGFGGAAGDCVVAAGTGSAEGAAAGSVAAEVSSFATGEGEVVGAAGSAAGALSGAGCVAGAGGSRREQPAASRADNAAARARDRIRMGNLPRAGC
jgi:hypothetical protein